MRKLSAEELVFVGKVKKWTAGVVAFFIIFGSWGIVGPGERGVRVTLGKVGTEVLGEGFHFKWPVVSNIKTMSIRIHKSQDSSEGSTKDIQKVNATVALNWTINPDSVGTMFQTVGDEGVIETNVIAPAVAEVLKASTAKLSAEEVLTKRMELKQTIDDMLVKRLSGYGLVVKDISLVNLDFTKEFNAAVEAKQISEQQAKQASYIAEKATQDAIATVNKAKGEAESVLVNARAQAEGQKLLKMNLTKEVLALEYLKKWDGTLPKVMSGSGGGIMLNMSNIDKEKE